MRSNTKLSGAAFISALILLGSLAACGKQDSAESLMAQAKASSDKGDNPAAIIQLKNALVKNPDAAQARLMLGKLYLDNDDAVSAEKELRAAIRLGVPAADALPGLVQSLNAQRKSQQVLDETLAESGKGDAGADLHAARGDAQLALGQADKAAESYELALKARPDQAAALIGQARLALGRNDVAGATALSEQAVTRNPNDAAGWMFKGDLLRMQGKPEQALAAFGQALKVKPKHRSAYVERAYVQIGMGKLDAARADLAAAAKITGATLTVTYMQALLDYTDGKYAPARESLQKVLRVAPEHMPSILLAGSVEQALGSMPQAELHLKKYLDNNPNNRYARKKLATVQLALGRAGDVLATLAPLLGAGVPADPQVLALAGEAHMQGREFDKATEYLEKAAKLAPDAAVVRTSLAMSRLAQGDDERAVAELEASTKLDTKSPKAGVLLVLTELRAKHFDKALAAAKDLEAKLPNDAMVHNLKGGVYLGMKDLASARAAFEKALQLQPAYYPATANLAQMAVHDKKPEEGKRLLLAFLEKDKKNIGAYNALADLAAGQNKTEEVTQWLEKASAENPEAIGPAMSLGAHYMRVGQKDKALTLVRKFQVANPKAPELLDLLGQIQLASGDNAAALETVSKLVGLAPKSARAHFRMAAVHTALKNEKAVAEDLKKALAAQPDFLDAQVAQIDMLIRKGQFEPALAAARVIQKQRDKEAVGYAIEGALQQLERKPGLAAAAFEKAFARAPTTANMVKLHSSLVAAGNDKDAAQRLDKFHAARPNDHVLTMYVAESLLQAKQYKAAIAKLEAVTKMAPNNPNALNNLAWAYQKEKDPRALKTAERALALAKDNPAIIDTLGWMLVEQGDTARGLPHLRRAVELAPKALEIRYHLASALAKSGDKANARKELEVVIVNGKNFAQLDEARALLKTL